MTVDARGNRISPGIIVELWVSETGEVRFPWELGIEPWDIRSRVEEIFPEPINKDQVPADRLTPLQRFFKYRVKLWDRTQWVFPGPYSHEAMKFLAADEWALAKARREGRL